MEADVFLKAGTSLEYIICLAQFIHDKLQVAWLRLPDLLNIEKVIPAWLSPRWGGHSHSPLKRSFSLCRLCPRSLFGSQFQRRKYLMMLSPLVSHPWTLFWPLEYMKIYPVNRFPLFFFFWPIVAIRNESSKTDKCDIKKLRHIKKNERNLCTWFLGHPC